jgi:hypothetical protein
VTFTECVLECFDNVELRAQFNRLYGCSIGVDRRSGIEKLVDRATGFEPPAISKDEAHLFIAFVWDCVWTRLPPECFTDTPEVKP